MTMKQRKQRGFSLAEAMVAGAVLTVSMIAGLSMILLGALANNRNKLDTSATLLAQNVMEVIQRAGASSTVVLNITDCTGTVRNIGTAGAAGGGAGAPLTATNQVDFSAGPVGNYSMNYVVCRADGDPVTYDVRWNVINQRVFTAGGLTTVYVKQITVAARPLGAAANRANRLRDFALPVSLRGATSQN
jgi:Tfp pilus assembly protein PilV